MLALHLCQLVCVISYWIRRVKRKKSGSLGMSLDLRGIYHI